MVEDETTVEPGTMLRAATYEAVMPLAASDNLKYFPVTLYNYDQTTINNATHQAEVDKAEAEGTKLPGLWQGIYFGDMYGKTQGFTASGTTETAMWRPISDLSEIDANTEYVIISKSSGETLNKLYSCKRLYGKSRHKSGIKNGCKGNDGGWKRSKRNDCME